MQTLPIAIRPPPKRRPRGSSPGGWLAGVALPHRAALAAAVVGAVACAVGGTVLAWRSPGNDFTVLYDASRALIDGHGGLDTGRPLHAPFWVLAVVPFALLPYHLAAALWSLACLIALLGCARTAARLLGRPGDPAWPWLLWLPGVLLWRPIASSLAAGRGELLILAVVLTGLRAITLQPARGRGGGWLGLSAAFWLPAGVFLLHLMARREWRAAVRGAAAVVVLVLLAAVSMRGIGGGLADLAQWARDTARSFAGSSPVVFGAMLLAAFLAPVLRRPAATGTAAWSRECAFAASTSLLVAALAHQAHWIWLLPAFAALTHTVAGDQGPAWRRRGTSFALAVAAVSISGVAGTAPGGRVALLGALVAHTWLGWAVIRESSARGWPAAGGG